jgi:hypothetical protein
MNFVRGWVSQKGDLPQMDAGSKPQWFLSRPTTTDISLLQRGTSGATWVKISAFSNEQQLALAEFVLVKGGTLA